MRWQIAQIVQWSFRFQKLHAIFFIFFRHVTWLRGGRWKGLRK
jgi:hypothetical protein